MKKIFWRFLIPFVSGFIVLTAFLYIVAIDKSVDFSSISTWDSLLHGYFLRWGNVLGIMTTAAFAFAVYWEISDKRYFRYIDDKTKVLGDLSKWLSHTFRNLTIPARHTRNLEVIISNIVECRNELVIAIAESIGVFGGVKSFVIANEKLIPRSQELLTSIADVDSTISQYVNLLFHIDVNNPLKEELDQIYDKAPILTGKMRVLMEIVSSIQ